MSTGNNEGTSKKKVLQNMDYEAAWLEQQRLEELVNQKPVKSQQQPSNVAKVPTGPTR
jgi:hypothetical protein